MATTITTARVQHPTSGARRIVAKGAGRQRTMPYDHSLSYHANHGAAAGILAKALGLDVTPTEVAVDVSTGKGRFVL